MRPSFLVSFLLVPLFAVGGGLSSSVVEQHSRGALHQLSAEATQFTFQGIFTGVSDTAVLNVHGGQRGLNFEVEQVVLGSFGEKSVAFPILEGDSHSFVVGNRYYITADWGSHGLVITGFKPPAKARNKLLQYIPAPSVPPSDSLYSASRLQGCR